MSMEGVEKVSTYIFFRKDGFYPLELESFHDKTDDEVAIDNANCNPGTLKVEKCRSGNTTSIIWVSDQSKH